ncbi:hypothetical protein HIM_01290 [Hirsutella minnesotensis 3608]|nr:hypothetical protein HIM_01290 [Hirsutella minnesotensis 3608]
MATQAQQYDHLQSQSHHRGQQRAGSQLDHSQQRPQAKSRRFSIRSDKSHRSGNSKVSHREAHDEKELKGLHTKADPSLAINEAEPAAVAMMEQSSRTPLRSIQHKDVWGNAITDPDKSNPTRNRWERPLDTIRGFEAAIDGGYSRKSLLHRSETQTSMAWSQRGGPRPQPQSRMTHDSYYGARAMSVRGDGQYGGNRSSSYFEIPQGHGANLRQLPRDRSQRLFSEQHHQTYGREQDIYPMPHKDRSYETVTSAMASGNSDAAGYLTDPTSSDNSSVDRVPPAKRHQPGREQGPGYGQSKGQYQVHGHAANHSLPSPPAEEGHFDQRPAVPPKQMSALSRELSTPHHGGPVKRKSWIQRRFSKGG